MGRSYEFLDHPADVGFIARGETIEECFAAAADALNRFGWEAAGVEPRTSLDVTARAATLEDLMFSWLSEVLYLSDGEQWMFAAFEITEIMRDDDGWRIAATVRGEKFDEARHTARTYVKAITYHQLEVKESPDGWQATVFIDV